MVPRVERAAKVTSDLQEKLDQVPPALKSHQLELANGGGELVYTYDSDAGRTRIADLLGDLAKAGISFKDIQTKESSLEDIFVSLVRERA